MGMEVTVMQPMLCLVQASTLLGVLWMENENKREAAKCFQRACKKEPPVCSHCLILFV